MRKLTSLLLVLSQLAYAAPTRTIEADNISGIAAGQNLVKNGAFELPINAISETAAAGAWSKFFQSTLSTGSSPSSGHTYTTSLSRTTGSSLGIGSNGLDLLLTTSGAGEGYAYTFTVPTGLKAKALTIRLKYQTDANYSDDKVEFWVYAVDGTAELKQPSAYQLKKVGYAEDKQPMEFQTQSDSTTYRLVIYQKANVGTNSHVYIDDLEISQRGKVNGAPVIDWQNYTPTFTNNTATIDTAQYRMVGDSLDLKLRFTTSGTGSAAFFSFSIPSGLSESVVGSTQEVGHCSTTHSTYFDLKVYTGANGATTLNFTTDNSALGNALNGDTFGTGIIFVCNITGLKIIGKSSSTQMSDSSSTRVITAGADRSTSATATAGTPLELVTDHVLFDSLGTALSGSTGRYTAQVPGYYVFTGFVDISTGGTAPNGVGFYFKKNGTGTQYGKISLVGSLVANKEFSTPVTATIQLNAGDYVSLWVDTSAQNVTVNGSAGNISGYYVSQIQGPAQIAASETVGMRAYANSTSTIPTVETIFNPSSVDYDTHGGWNISTGYTCPINGLYRARIQYVWTSSAVGTTYGVLYFNNVKKAGTYQSNPTANATNQTVITEATARCLAGQVIKPTYFTNGFAASLVAGTEAEFFEITRVGN